MVVAIDGLRLAYMPLPKAACSSVKAMLAELDPTVDVRALPRTPVPADKFHTLYPTMRFRPHRWERYGKGWFRFCVLRDPCERLMSCYTHRVVELGELRNSRKIRDKRVNLPTEPDADFFFQNLSAYQDAASSIRHHTLPAWLFVGPSLAAYDRVYTTRNLDWLADDLSDRVGYMVQLPHSNQSSQTLNLAMLRPETRTVLETYLRDEYAFMANFFQSPFARLHRRRGRAA